MVSAAHCSIKMKKIGIMGGTFDPPHIGHMAMAQRVFETMQLDSVLFIPTGGVYYKDSSHMLPPKTRLAMVRAAVADNERFIADAIEAESGKNSYTYQTLEKLQKKYTDAELVFIVGADSLDYMDSWREPERIFSVCHVAAVNRTGISERELIEKKRQLEEMYNAGITLVNMPVLNVSSTQLRTWVRQGHSIRYWVPEAVFQYIQQHRLYTD